MQYTFDSTAQAELFMEFLTRTAAGFYEYCEIEGRHVKFFSNNPVDVNNFLRMAGGFKFGYRACANAFNVAI
jgi:hypothetical protein